MYVDPSPSFFFLFYNNLDVIFGGFFKNSILKTKKENEKMMIFMFFRTRFFENTIFLRTRFFSEHDFLRTRFFSEHDFFENTILEMSLKLKFVFFEYSFQTKRRRFSQM